MKWIAQLFLMVFVAFLATPTVVSLIEKNTDTSYFYSTAEEEQPHKEVKADLHNGLVYTLISFPETKSAAIHAAHVTRHDNIASAIFIPPPEQV